MKLTNGLKRLGLTMLLGGLFWPFQALSDEVLLEEDFENNFGAFETEGYVELSEYGARIRGSYFGNSGSMVVGPLDTHGLSGLTLQFDHFTYGLDRGEFGEVAYSLDGHNFMRLSAEQSVYGSAELALPVDAENQPNVYIRFSVEAGRYFERYTIDNVLLRAEVGPPDCEPTCGDDDGEPDNGGGDDSDNGDGGDDGNGDGSGGEGHARGPDPTNALLEQQRGPFSIGSESISSFAASGFGGATVYYPDNAQGPFAVIAISPGYTARQSSIRWWGNLLASHGFIAVTIDTLSTSDTPNRRAEQLVAALNQVANMNQGAGPLAGLIDADRMGVMGHSMGGGGALIAAQDNPSLIKAAVPLAPWNSSSRFSSTEVPTLIVGCENDATASVRRHALAFYESLPSSLDKAYLEVSNGSHFCVLSDSGENVLGKYAVSWMKRFLDQDTRYSPFLCGAEHEDELVSGVFSDYRETCPY
ncbi:alpha/beta hydrolase family protein [Marinimicrobium locisalis]|uniref:alpha/beta hydrolase family protein n=1 Tax=Marinimicrobium locisalis TaxID=546022 RepID=UPI0032216084